MKTNENGGDWVRITVVCFIGAVIGAFLALDIAQRFVMGKWFAGVGILLGATISWALFDWKHFLRVTTQMLREFKVKHLPPPDWRRVTKALMFCGTFLSWHVLWFFGFCYALFRSNRDVSVITSMHVVFIFLSFLCLMVNIMLTTLRHRIHPLRGEDYLFDSDHIVTTREFGKMCLRLSPVGLVFEIIITLCIGVLALGGCLTDIFLSLCFFASNLPGLAWQVFLRVHSEKRLICFIGGGVGAAIGFFAGNVWLGGIAGAIVGYLEYQLVAVRWLKLKPGLMA